MTENSQSSSAALSQPFPDSINANVEVLDDAVRTLILGELNASVDRDSRTLSVLSSHDAPSGTDRHEKSYRLEIRGRLKWRVA